MPNGQDACGDPARTRLRREEKKNTAPVVLGHYKQATKHVVLIAKVNMNEEVNTCIIDGNKVDCSNETGCLNTRLMSYFDLPVFSKSIAFICTL
jgi:hypothetical protein